MDCLPQGSLEYTRMGHSRIASAQRRWGWRRSWRRYASRARNLLSFASPRARNLLSLPRLSGLITCCLSLAFCHTLVAFRFRVVAGGAGAEPGDPMSLLTAYRRVPSIILIYVVCLVIHDSG